MLSPHQECAHTQATSHYSRQNRFSVGRLWFCTSTYWLVWFVGDFNFVVKTPTQSIFPQSYLCDQFIHRGNRKLTIGSKVRRKNILFILHLFLFHFYLFYMIFILRQFSDSHPAFSFNCNSHFIYKQYNSFDTYNFWIITLTLWRP